MQQSTDAGAAAKGQHCGFCGSSGPISLWRSATRHKVDASFGPFDIGVCGACGSAVTMNPPSPDRLAAFYEAYDSNRPDWYLEAREGDLLAEQYGFYADRVLAGCDGGAPGAWAEIGAGFGEVASILAARFPQNSGVAVDIPPRPDGFPAAVDYRRVDLNRPGWLDSVGATFDTVYSIAVWEHVLDPALFAEQCLSLVAPGGRLVLVCPAWDTLARKVMGERWPYFLPGEHLGIPTKDGARRCLEQAMTRLGADGEVDVAHMPVGYNLRYVLRVGGLTALARLAPSISIPAPTGVLRAIVRRR